MLFCIYWTDVDGKLNTNFGINFDSIYLSIKLKKKKNSKCIAYRLIKLRNTSKDSNREIAHIAYELYLAKAYFKRTYQSNERATSFVVLLRGKQRIKCIALTYRISLTSHQRRDDFFQQSSYLRTIQICTSFSVGVKWMLLKSKRISFRYSLSFR